jgi:DNA-directed RNA polymerase subunit M/transcription elongation factor TFIIS
MTSFQKDKAEAMKAATLHEKQLGKTQANTTNQLTCPKCKAKDASYTEVRLPRPFPTCVAVACTSN